MNQTWTSHGFSRGRLVWRLGGLGPILQQPENPDLVIISRELWRKTRCLLAESRRRSPHTGRPKSRNEKNPSALFSGTLFCDCCGHELKLIRSAGENKQLGTINGSVGAHGCKLAGLRSTRVIEDCLLNYLRANLLTPAVVEDVVVNANAFLDEEAKKPIPKTTRIKNQIANRSHEIERLVRRSAKTDDVRSPLN